MTERFRTAITIDERIERALANSVRLWAYRTAVYQHVSGGVDEDTKLFREVRDDLSYLRSSTVRHRAILQSIAQARTLSEAQRLAIHAIGEVDAN